MRTQTDHFNGLSEAEQERLSIVIEECGEVIQAACKILRHGYESYNPETTVESNREAFERELGDLSHGILRMQNAYDISEVRITERRNYKGDHIKLYLHHQEVEG